MQLGMTHDCAWVAIVCGAAPNSRGHDQHRGHLSAHELFQDIYLIVVNQNPFFKYLPVSRLENRLK
jgi:hypothetical protein